MMKLPCYEKNILLVFACHVTQAFSYKKYVGCYGCARSANFVYYFKSIYSCLPLHPTYINTPHVLRTRTIIVNEVHYTLSNSPRRLYRGSIYFQTKAVIVCVKLSNRINVTVSVHTSIATHACMSVSESQKTWPKASEQKSHLVAKHPVDWF